MKKNKFLVIILVLFFILSFLLQDWLKNSFYLISAPVQKFLWDFGRKFSSFSFSIFKCREFEKKVSALESENLKLKAEIEELKILKKENEILRKGLQVKEEKMEILPARILGKDINQDKILINKGKEDGVFEGEVVITPEKTLLGKVSKVYQNFSKVTLITEKDFSFNVQIPAKKIEGLAKGGGGTKLILSFLPKEEKIEEKEKIITSELGGEFPKGILVGEIEELKKFDFKPYQEAKVKIGFSLNELEIVFLIKNFKPWRGN